MTNLVFTLIAFLLYPLDYPWALYLIIFGILILSAVGLPVPEEVTLILGGYLAYLEFTSFWPTIFALVAGIVIADMLGYFLGRYAGEWIYKKIAHIKHLAGAEEKVKKLFDNWGEKIVIFSRPIIWVRFLIPMFSGYFKMKFWKFLLYDLIGAIPWVALIVFLTYYLGFGLNVLISIKNSRNFIFLILVFVVFTGLAIKFLRYSAKN